MKATSTQPTRCLVTGATGLIGRHLVARLLSRGEHVSVLVRPASLASRAAVIERWREQAPDRLTVLQGDICTPGLAVPPEALQGVDHVYHLAALYDLEASAEQLQRTNVHGTRHVLEALQAAGFAGTLHHVSSVAVAGDFRGEFTEEMFDQGQKHPHPYQRSKFDAEATVRASTGLRWRILRPSAVVGHSVTGEIDAIDGPYYLFGLLRRLGGAFPGWFPLTTLRRGAINMVPVDFVAAVIDLASRRADGDGQVVHVVDPDPPSYRETFNILARLAGAPTIRTRIRGPIKRWIAGARQLGNLASVRFLRDQALSDLGIPPQVLDAFADDQRLGAERLRLVLADAQLECPKQADYLPALWCYWLQHLDPTRRPEEARRACFRDRVVLVTGASSGVGAALAVQVGELGAHVVLVARRRELLDQVAERVRATGARATVLAADLSDMSECDRVVQATLDEHGRLDILVNNAARSIRRPVAESLERFHDFERVMQINYFAPVRLIRAALPGMRERRSGHIVNVLTAGVALPGPMFGAYGSSKAALSHLTDTLAAEHLHEGVRFMAAYLGWVRTPMMGATGKYDKTAAMSPDEAARWIVDGITRGDHRLMTADTARRWVLNGVAGKSVTRVLNVIYRIYADDTQHPELAPDRAILRSLIPGRLI